MSGSPQRPTSRNVFFATVSAASAGLLLLLSVLISNVLGTEAWGQFSFALALSMIGEALMDFGIHQVTIRSIARERGEAAALFRNSLALKALPGAAMFVALSALAFWLRPQTDMRIVCVLMLASAVFRSYLLTVRGVLQGLERFADDSFVVIADRLAVLVFGAAAIWLHGGLVGLAAAFLAARVVTMAGALWIVQRHVGAPRLAFDTGVWKDLQRRAMPLGAFLIVLNLYSYIDTLILGALTTDLETGLYNSAYKTYEGLTYATAILSAVITPRLSHLWSADRPAHGRLVRQSLAASIGLAIVLAAAAWWMGPMVLRIFGPTAVSASGALRILAVGLPFVFAIWILHAVAISVFEERWLFRTTVIGSLVNIALNFQWIPQYHRNGAAAATVAGELVSLVVLLWALRHAVWPAGAKT
jgi:O-antigen/teichoic acid export membrane protein